MYGYVLADPINLIDPTGLMGTDQPGRRIIRDLDRELNYMFRNRFNPDFWGSPRDLPRPPRTNPPSPPDPESPKPPGSDPNGPSYDYNDVC